MHRGILPLLPTKGGEGRGEEGRFLFGFPSPQPSPHSFLAGRGRRPEAAMPLNSMAVPWGGGYVFSARGNEGPFVATFVATFVDLRTLRRRLRRRRRQRGQTGNMSGMTLNRLRE